LIEANTSLYYKFQASQSINYIIQQQFVINNEKEMLQLMSWQKEKPTGRKTLKNQRTGRNKKQ